MHVFVYFLVVWNPWAQKAISMADFGDDEVCSSLPQVEYFAALEGQRKCFEMIFKTISFSSLVVSQYAMC